MAVNGTGVGRERERQGRERGREREGRGRLYIGDLEVDRTCEEEDIEEC